MGFGFFEKRVSTPSSRRASGQTGRWASGHPGRRADGPPGRWKKKKQEAEEGRKPMKKLQSSAEQAAGQGAGQELRFATFIFHWKLFP